MLTISREPLAEADLKPVPVEHLHKRRPPVFADVAEERRHRKVRLAAGFRLFGRFGFGEGTAGHITARDPEFTDYFWVNPFGMSFQHIKTSDLMLVDHDGNIVQGRHELNQAAFAIHSEIHRARPDVISAAHSHSLYGKSLSSTDQILEPLTQDACAFYDDHSVFDNYSGLVYDPHEGKRLADTLGAKKAVILRNHGLITVGHTVDSAVWWFITMERSAHAQLTAKAAGATRPIPDEVARHTHDEIGLEDQGWFQFQPLFDQISRTDPDLFD